MYNASVFLMSLKGKVPDDAILALQNSVEKADESSLQKLMFLNLKNPVIGIVLSLLFGILGVDRFYKGDIKLGIIKIALLFASLIILIASIISAAGVMRPFMSDDEMIEVFLSEYLLPLVLAFVCLIASYVWAIADIFLVFFGIKKDNLAKIYEALR